jgi:hypothetical protein
LSVLLCKARQHPLLPAMKTTALAKPFAILLAFLVVSAACCAFLQPLLHSHFSSLPFASLNVPVTSSVGPNSPPSRKDVLLKYPARFVTDQSDGRRTTVAAHMYGMESWGLAALCVVGWDSVFCFFIDILNVASFPFKTLVPLPVSSLNVVVPKSFPSTEITREEVLKYYPRVFAVDWENGKLVTEAAIIMHDYFNGGDTTCDIGINSLNCVSGDLAVFESGFPFFLCEHCFAQEQ